MSIILETKKLILREFNLNDAPFIIELLNSEGWIKNIGDRNVRSTEQAIEYLNNGPLKSYRENGFGLWMVELKENYNPIGMCGLIKRPILENIDIGFALLPQFSGKGYAFEMAQSTMNYAVEVLKLKIIDAIVLPDNSNSIKLIEKLGMNYHSTFIYPDTNEILALYRFHKS